MSYGLFSKGAKRDVLLLASCDRLSLEEVAKDLASKGKFKQLHICPISAKEARSK